MAHGVRAAPAVDPVLVVAAAALAGPLAASAPAAVALAAFGLAVLGIGRAIRVRLAITIALAVVVAAGCATRAMRAVDRVRGADAALEVALPRPARCALDGEVVASPTRRHGAFRVIVDVVRASCDAGELPRDGPPTRVALVTELPSLARGDAIHAIAQLAPLEKFDDPELGDPFVRAARSGVLRSGAALGIEVRARGHGVGAAIDRARAHVRARIDATFQGAAAPMARALVLGESDLDDDDDAAFRASGLSHLLAVSGMHLVLVVLSIERALAFALRRSERLAGATDVGRIAAAVTLAAAWLYADFAGGSGSALRAAWMLSVLLLARVFARRTTGPRALALSTLAAASCDPLVVFDISFALSLAATAGLFAIAPRLVAWFAPDGAPAGAAAGLGRSIATTLAASIACAPLLAGLGPALPLGGLLANVVAVPLGEAAALPLCILHAFLAPVPLLELGCARAASGALLAVRAVARASSTLPYGALPVPLPTPAQIAAIAVALAALLVPRARARTAVLAACAFVLVGAEVLARREGAPHGRLRVTMLDVGQGDALLVDLPDGQAALIDAGGLVGSPVDVGARVIAPVLRARRRRELALVVLSHPHPDHYGGLAAGLAGVRARRAWDTGQGEAEESAGARAALAAVARAGATLERPAVACGTHALGGAVVEVLAPCPGFDPDRGPNDNSFVVRIRYGARSFLFVGDAERAAESTLLAAHRDDLRADVLKVGHHGSATSSSPAFLAAVRPSVALVSVGARNRFGHPRAETLAALGQVGARVFRTDRDGQVVVETDGTALSVRSARGGPGPLYTSAAR